MSKPHVAHHEGITTTSTTIVIDSIAAAYKRHILVFMLVVMLVLVFMLVVLNVMVKPGIVDSPSIKSESNQIHRTKHVEPT